MLRYIKKRANRGESGGSNGGEGGDASDTGSSTLLQASLSSEVANSSTGTSNHHSTVPMSPTPVAPPKNMKNKRKNSKQDNNLAEQQRYLDETILAQKVEHLSNFDACIEACDALAASTATSANSTARRDAKSNLVDCSVLVSPDGELLLLPSRQQQPTLAADCVGDAGMDGSSTHFVSPLVELGEDYESAVYVGNDLDARGDQAWNGFTANGWSIPAASLALRQTEQSLHDFADFCEEIVLSKKEASARNNVACDKLRAVSYERGPVYPDDLRQDATTIMQEETTTKFELTQFRVGPMLFNGGTLHKAHVALEEFYNDMAESECERWRLASLQRKGALPPLRKAATRAEERSANRQETLRETYLRVKKMEDHLNDCKAESQKRWKDVEQAEETVTKLVAERMMERNKKLEEERLKEFQKQGEQQQANNGGNNSNNNHAEILDVVSQVAASMENGSFEPMDFGEAVASAATPITPPPIATPDPDDLPIASRMDIEEEVGLPELRAAAFQADRLVRDASGSLLNVLSSLDQIKRSARISAETNLLAACNSQADCIRSVIRLERAAVEERMQRIEELERIVDKIDVRRDLNTYIKEDRKRPGGSAPLGQDDDGGIASALAVLSSHVEGDMGMDTPRSLYGREASEPKDSIAKNVSSEELEEALEKLFLQDDFLDPDAPESLERQQARDEFDKAVQLLCNVAIEKSTAARPKRSRMCYAFNAKRSSHAEIKTPIQFEALCKLFSSILSGCDCETGGVSNAKMCMMLSQTFYFAEKVSSGDGEEKEERSKRVYVKNRLIGHPMWLDSEFWDQVLFQCLSESLTNSGVMSNFERQSTSENRTTEWREGRKIQWYDLTPAERTEAASQVHAVVFAQLGALAHSMMEFGCGLEQSCAFVRRMAIRNQLPLSQRTMLLQHLVERGIGNEAEEISNVGSIAESDEKKPEASKPNGGTEEAAKETE